MTNLRHLALPGAILLLAACGGGGGDSGGGGNRAPVFSSPAQITIDEGTTGEIYTLTVSDPDGDPVELSVVARNDWEVFDYEDSFRTIVLNSPLDFEAPVDANADNVYELRFTARDTASGLQTQFDLQVTVADVAEAGALTQIGSGFSQPLFVAPIPGTTLLAVAQKGGLVRVLDPATGTVASVPLLDVSGDIATDGERGLLGMAFSPDFVNNRQVYVNLTNTSGDTEIRRYEMFAGSDTQADPATADLIFTTPQPASNHNAGWIGFSNDGLLYVPLGDGGGAGDPDGNAQDVNEILGKVLRLDVSGDDFPADDARDYAIPAGNPFASGGGRPEIFATGLRNLYRCSVDPVTGDLFIADVGQGAIEEINRLAPDGAGTNFGWNLQEGTQSYAGGADSPDFTDPVAEYGHGSGPLQGNSVTGGYVYRGAVAAVQDHYIFGDFVSGNYWSVPVADLQTGSTVPSSQFQRLNDLFPADTGTVSNISSFGLDADGNLLIVDFGGSIYRLHPVL